MVGFDRSQTRDSNQIKSLSPTEYTALLPGGSDLQKENREGISTCFNNDIIDQFIYPV